MATSKLIFQTTAVSFPFLIIPKAQTKDTAGKRQTVTPHKRNL